MRRILILPFLIFCSVITLQAQSGFQEKYHMLDSAELYIKPHAGKAFTPTSPPSGTVRAIAEWEPMQAVMVTYPGNFGIPYALIAEMSENTHVITIVESTSQQNSVTIAYNNNGVNLSNCSFYIEPLDSYWVRDYGPWFVMVNNSEVAIVDFPYNRPSRVDDDNIPVVMSSILGTDLYGMNIISTGGNYMCDGMGVAASTDLVTDENPSLTVAQIDTLMKQFLGVQRFYITTDPLGGYIKHIDCWGKFLDVDKILVGKVSVSDSRYNDYEAMAAFWAGEISSYGTPYQVFRTYSPNGQPYTNSLILNKKVLVPVVYGTGSSNNSAALAVYQQAMPGYEVIGFASNSWAETDALHCRTHEVADIGMLYISHFPLLGTQPHLSQYVIAADIYALSGSNIVADSVWMRYRVNAGSWVQSPMSFTAPNHWSASISSLSPGDSVEYFIHAADLSPRSVSHPVMAAWDPHKFFVGTLSPVKEVADQKHIVFPNPARDFLFVQPQNAENLSLEISLCNVLGEKIITTNYSGSEMVKLDMRGLAAGTYYLMIIQGGNKQTFPVVLMP